MTKVQKAVDRDIARRVIPLLDLTNLDDNCGNADIDRLAGRAVTPHGPVAALCVWPRFVGRARRALGDAPVRIATVVNFPAGEAGGEATAREAVVAIGEGADEIDMVVPYHSLADGPGLVESEVGAVRAALDGVRPGVTLKAILETGEVGDTALIRAASDAAIRAGADFLKTSTGKVKVNATPEAARVMLEAIRESREQGGRPCGFKAAGGIRTVADAALYLDLADRIMGKGWATSETFRFGASGLLDALLATLGGRTAKAGEGY